MMTNFYKLSTLTPRQLAKYLVYPSGTYDCVCKTTWGGYVYEDYLDAIDDTVRWLNEEVEVQQ